MEESGPPSNPSAVASRGRGRGRPPKAAPLAVGHTPTPSSLAVKNADAVASNTPPEDQDSGQNECRRSSRKKIIKFDVRDLLNKNRKAHKIQIEARIDSNPIPGQSTGTIGASTSTSMSAASAASASPAASVSRLFSMFEMSHPSLPPPPPPPALEIFAKPRPTQSLIVAQVTSEPSAAGGGHPVQTMVSMPAVTPRKRGRPRKSQPADVAIVPTVIAPSCFDSDTNSTSTTFSNMSSDSGESPGFPKRKPKSKLRVSLKRLNLSRRQESSDSGNSPSSSPEVEPPALQDENALDEQPDQEQNLTQMVVGEDNSDSDSQIIFIEIETESPKGQEEHEDHEEQEEERPVELEPQELIDIDIELAKQGPTPDPDQDLDDIMVEVLSGPPSLWSADDEAEEEEEDVTVQRATPPENEPTTDSSSPAPRRSRRSAPLSGSSRQGKTLEETFAEIAAESSKQILEAEDQEEQHILIDLIEDTLSEAEVTSLVSPILEDLEVEEIVVDDNQLVEEVDVNLDYKQELVIEAAAEVPETKAVASKPEQVFSESDKIIATLKAVIPEPKVEAKAPRNEELAIDVVPKPELVTEDVPIAQGIAEIVEQLHEKTTIETKPPTEIIIAETKPSLEVVKETPPKYEADPKAPQEDLPESKPAETIPASERIPHIEVGTKAPLLLSDSDTRDKAIGEVLAEHTSHISTVEESNKKAQKTEFPTEISALKTETAQEDRPLAAPAEDTRNSSSDELKSLEKSERNQEREQDKVAGVETKERNNQVEQEKTPIPEMKTRKRPLKKGEKEVGKCTKETALEKNVESKKSCPGVTPGKQKETGKAAKEKPSAKTGSSSMDVLDKASVDFTPKKDKDTAQCPPLLPISERSSTKPLQESTLSEISKSTWNEGAVAAPDAPKEEKAGKKPPTKEKLATGFVECDAMFKALDVANAQMRLEEKSKKKLKKVPPKAEAPSLVPTAVTVPGQKKSLARKASSRRNTVYEDSPKHNRNSSPSSDSAQANTSAGKLTRSKAKKKPNPRRSTICEGAKDLRSRTSSTPTEEVAVSSPVSTSSDSSSKRNASKRTTRQMAGGSKLDQRRNTICEDRQAEIAIPVPLTKRRFSMHPKASANPLHDTLLRTAGKKRARKGGKESLSRQSSLDSSSSASQGASKKKALKSAEALNAALLETESSESTSSGSKMRRWNVQASPELDATNSLSDIAKFIEDGVNLLKRDYKVDEDQREEGQDEVKREANPEKDEFAQRVANMETPATTPSPSPTQSNPEDSATSTTILKESNTGAGVRRSHRIKQKPQGQRASQGRGVASMALAPISMDEQLAELANIEAINEQFLRREGLNTFQLLKENYYRCARQVSQENAEMQCDCFLTGDEEAQGHLSCGAGCINRMLMIECGPLCTNGARCTNKRFQQHQCWPCRVFRTEKKGCGITAELQIPPGEFIMEYVGEVIDSEEFERRQHLYSKDRNRHYYFMALRGEAIIDATSKGNISRYINHSCDPNAETQKWTVNGELRIGFFSVKPIRPGEEITFDYQYQRYGRDAQRCYCESANCRGWIGGEPDSDEGEQLDVESDSEADLDEEELEAEPEAEGGQSRKSSKAKSKSKLKAKLPPATGRKRKEQPKPKDREYKAGRWLKPSAGGSSSEEKGSRKPKVNKFHAMLEDPDVLEELSLLSRSGLKNQLDTLRFSRCMVRAKLLQTRLQLLGVLSRGELPCRRLFLDYHGLRLLHAWISENGNDEQLRVALLNTLESLPIPNRTMLNDSRVYHSVQLWSNGLEQQKDAAPHSMHATLHKRMVALLQKWQALPEIFRIPKREQIEQMKENEREADRQQKHVHASTALEDQRERESSSDRFRQDRFRRDTTSSRISKPIRMSGNNTICTITTQQKGSNGAMVGMARNDSRRRSDMGPSTESSRTLSKELRRSLFERKVALDEAERRVCSEDWREHELRCEFFGADLNTDPKQLPFYQHVDSGEWFNSDDKPVPAPPRTELLSQALLSPEMDGGQAATAVEYKLPAGVDPLPPAWHWRITSDGDIYYYNLRERISQWEPPSPEQRLQTLLEAEPTQQPLHELQNDPALLANDLIDVDVDYVGSLSSKSLAQYVEAKVRERRDLRRSRLVSIRLISPRRDEDRLYNQLESRKYKENKEKIRRRKELYRRRKLDVLPDSSADSEDDTPDKPLPIQAYLYSSDEDETEVPVAKPAATEGSVAPEADEESLNLAPSTSHAAMAALGKSVQATQATQPSGVGAAGKRKLPMPPIVSMKKQRQEERVKKVTSSQSPLATNSGRDAHEKFRFDISGHVADFLRPYRKESCQLGRITSDEDYKFLINRLSNHITTKEVRYCDTTGHPLSCTESVKHKSYDFINQYMRKKGRVYRKPAESPMF